MRVLSLFLYAFLGFIALLPILIIFQIVKSKAGSQSSTWSFAGVLALAFYISSVFTVTGVPSVRYITFDCNLNLIPFANLTVNLLQYMQNMILFLPLGFLLPLLWKRYRSWIRTAVFGFTFSLSIEMAQLFNFRATDIDDLIMNTAGALLGFLLYRLAIKIRIGLKDKFCLTGENEKRGESVSGDGALPYFVIFWFSQVCIQTWISSFL